MDELMYFARIRLKYRTAQWSTQNCQLFEAELRIILIIVVRGHFFSDDVVQWNAVMTQNRRQIVGQASRPCQPFIPVLEFPGSETFDKAESSERAFRMPARKFAV